VCANNSVGLTTQPKVTLSAASGYRNIVFGAEAAYDTAKSTVSNYGLALGLHAGDSQLAVHLQVGLVVWVG
jgi:voltage-dependent anion channel protein 2